MSRKRSALPAGAEEEVEQVTLAWSLRRPSPVGERRMAVKIMGVVGLLSIALGEVLSFIRILPWSQYVFSLFWHGYILVLDSINNRLKGHSLISHCRHEFYLMLPISVLYWYVFEWYNLLIQNWLYINMPAEKWNGIALKIISFATVIPALAETADLLTNLSGEGKELGTRPLIPANWRTSSFVLGLSLSLLPLLYPRIFFWSVWLGLFFLIEPINDWLGRPSLLRDWREGKLRRTAVWLFAGYICGFFWEIWNYWAYTKWIYAVPVPDMPYIFEMPILGFLGFGPFALETFAFWMLVWGERVREGATKTIPRTSKGEG